MIILIVSIASLLLIALFFFIDSFFSILRNQKDLEIVSGYPSPEINNFEEDLMKWKLEKNLETLTHLNKLEIETSHIKLPIEAIENYKEAKFYLRANTVEYCNDLKARA